MRTSTTLNRALSVLTLVSLIPLSACFGPIFPTDNPLPYTDSKYARVEVGSSTQDEVAKIFGKPGLELRDGTLWIYGRTRAKLTDGLGAYRHDYQAIFIEYVDGVVVAKDILHSDQNYQQFSCWSDAYGLCLHPNWEYKSGNSEPGSLSRKMAAVTSSGDDDVYAKKFVPAEGRCSVYVVSGTSFFRKGIPVVSLLELSDEPIPGRGYLFVESLPGNLLLQAGKNEADIDCQADSIYFYKVETLIFEDADDIGIDQLSIDEGKESVRERDIVVTW